MYVLAFFIASSLKTKRFSLQRKGSCYTVAMSHKQSYKAAGNQSSADVQ